MLYANLVYNVYEKELYVEIEKNVLKTERKIIGKDEKKTKPIMQIQLLAQISVLQHTFITMQFSKHALTNSKGYPIHGRNRSKLIVDAK